MLFFGKYFSDVRIQIIMEINYIFAWFTFPGSWNFEGQSGYLLKDHQKTVRQKLLNEYPSSRYLNELFTYVAVAERSVTWYMSPNSNQMHKHMSLRRPKTVDHDGKSLERECQALPLQGREEKRPWERGCENAWWGFSHYPVLLLKLIAN